MICETENKKTSFRLLFFEARVGDGKVLDDGISVYTTIVNTVSLLCGGQYRLAWQVIKRRYSHVAVWWPSRTMGYSRDGRYTGECFTSTTRDGYDGTIVCPASEAIKDVERCDYIEIPVSDYDLCSAKFWAYRQVRSNKGYNKKTIRGFFNPFRKQEKEDLEGNNICSTASQGFCVAAKVFRKWYKWSPLRLWWKTHKLGYVTRRLANNEER